MSSLLLKVQNRAGLHFTFKPKDDITNDKEIWVRFFFYSRYNPYISLIQVLIRTKSSWLPAKGGGLLVYHFLRNSCFWPPALFVIIMKMKIRVWERERQNIYVSFISSFLLVSLFGCEIFTPLQIFWRTNFVFFYMYNCILWGSILLGILKRDFRSWL